MTSSMTRPIGPVDTIWLNMDRANNLMVVSSVMFLEPVPDWDKVEKRIRTRVIDRYPVFQQRPVPSRMPLGRPSWVHDDAFDVARHVHRVTLPEPGDDAELQRFIETRLHQPFDHRHPLWEVHLVDGHGAGAALVTRTHHALADGMALARVLLELTDDNAVESVETSDEAAEDAAEGGDEGGDDGSVVVSSLDIAGTIPPTGPLPATALARAGVDLTLDLAVLGWRRARELVTRRGASAAAGLAVRTTRVAGELLFTHNPDNPLRGSPHERKRVVWAQPTPLDALKGAGRLAGATLNDVLMSAVAAALHTYQVEEHADPVDLVTMVPVNVRPLDEPIPAELGNRFALVFFHLPSALGTTLGRLVETKRRMDWIKSSPEAQITYGLINVIGRTNRTLERYLVDFFANKAIGVTTNVVGPRTPRYLAGAKVTGVLGWVPGSGQHTVGVCLVTYAGHAQVGFLTDASVVPHPERLLAAFEDELDRLAAWGTATPTTTPGGRHAHRQRTPRADRPRSRRAGAGRAE